jgi:PAS domain S-box-containing protein
MQRDELEPIAIDPAFRSIAQASPDLVMLVARDGVIRFINWTLPEYTVDGVIGTSMYDYLPEEYRSRVQATIERVMTTGRPDRYETAHVTPEGRISYWEARVEPVSRDGRVVGAAISSSNVTELQREAVERQRFFNLSRDMLCVLDGDGRLLRANPAFETTLGHGYDELAARPLPEWVHPDDRKRTENALRRLASEPFVDFENRCVRHDGEYRTISWRAVSDAPSGRIYAVARDDTDRHELERRLLHSQKMDAVGRLAGGIAHDFNNLVLAIVGNVDFAAKELDQPAVAAAHLDEIRKAARRAAELTRQLLAFSRRQPMQSESIDVNELTRDLLSLLRRLIPESIEIEFQAAADLPRVEADPAQIEQVLVNLCVNARDAMAGAGRLRIVTAVEQVSGGGAAADPALPAGAYVVLRVADTGPGIAPQVRERLFEPFFSTKSAEGGSGLGLATAYGIVEQHRGAIRVHSEPGAGATFEVLLPVTRREGTPKAGAQRGEAPGGTEILLVADDEAVVRAVVVEILKRAGYRVLTATAGAEAVEIYRERPGEIALVLLDVIMPGMRGPEAAAAIRAIDPDACVLFTSGYSDEAELAGHGIDPASILRKPYDPDVLLRRVREALDGVQRHP